MLWDVAARARARRSGTWAERGPRGRTDGAGGRRDSRPKWGAGEEGERSLGGKSSGPKGPKKSDGLRKGKAPGV